MVILGLLFIYFDNLLIGSEITETEYTWCISHTIISRKLKGKPITTPSPNGCLVEAATPTVAEANLRAYISHIVEQTKTRPERFRFGPE
ncbi:hypothetical protein X801_09620 [Opisthorchis viverrini]|uniref:Uncharacterized protein n=1 Tax=Opisthorchis viverrini TaxID=6198 RepID=A0A1S8WJG1_OPIVI|nr:hypothetical protein X801_09620 [Opisthorchis viverrini]